MIDVVNVTLGYPAAKESAVSDASFAVPRGQLTAIVGPNGSGKSTIVRALLGRLKPRRGEFLVDGVPLGDLTRRALARRMAVVPQREEPVFPLTVNEYVSLGRLPFQDAWRARSAEDAGLVREALDRAGVASDFSNRPIDELSGGEWQRVRIARALVQNGEAIALDEPTTFLDVAHEMAVFELARTLAGEGRAVLVVSHQINLVARFADTMVLLHRGRVAALGPPESVMRGELLEQVYEWPLVVARDPAVGAPVLIPLRVK